jgi:hypothetical protein
MGRPKGSKNKEVVGVEKIAKTKCPKRDECRMYEWYCKECERYELCLGEGMKWVSPI